MKHARWSVICLQQDFFFYLNQVPYSVWTRACNMQHHWNSGKFIYRLGRVRSAHWVVLLHLVFHFIVSCSYLFILADKYCSQFLVSHNFTCWTCSQTQQVLLTDRRVQRRPNSPRVDNNTATFLTPDVFRIEISFQFFSQSVEKIYFMLSLGVLWCPLAFMIHN